MPNTISLDRILHLRVPVAWHEAVTAAQTIADRAAERQLTVGLDTCLLSTDGSVDFAGASARPLTGDPRQALLSLLLDRSQAPAELSALMLRLQTSPPAHGDLARDLAFFTRPDPGDAIAALAARAIAAEANAASLSALEQLRTDAAAEPEPPPASPSRRRRVRLVVAAATTAAVLLALAATMAPAPSAPVVAATASSAVDTATAAVETATAALDDLVDRGLRSLGVAAAEAPAPQAEMSAPRRTAAATTPATPRPRPYIVAADAAKLPPPAPLASPVTDAAPIIAATVVAPDFTVYEEHHAAVAPPALLWPQLPSLPEDAAPDPATPYLELLVNEVGRVDKVRLHAVDSTLHDRMLVSAAKAWMFTPATKDGRPVRYLLRVPVTY